MQNERDCFGYYNFEQIHDFVKFFLKSDDAFQVYVILDKNVYL